MQMFPTETDSVVGGSEIAAVPSACAPTPNDADNGPRYVPGGLLGVGGMGEVRVAHDRVLGRDVAMKTPRLASPSLMQRLVAEARLAANLEHPGIVPVHDAGWLADGTPFYTMRLVRGRTLATALAERGDTGLRLVRHVLDAARAVAWAHARGVLHRDLKPANIIVGPAGETQVIDWGLGGLDSATERDGRLGTPGFMSPEAACGENLDARADVYGLGACLAAVLDVMPRPFPEAAAIATRACAEEPAQRYPTASAFADDLERFLDGRPVAAHTYRLRDHFGRWWRGARVALVTVATAILAITALLVAGIVRIGSERDAALRANAEARRALARALVSEAETLDEAGARPEAEIAAAKALTLSPDGAVKARALGLAARNHARPIISLQSTSPIGTCHLTRISASGRWLACADDTYLHIKSYDAEAGAWRAVWHQPASVSGAALLDDAGFVVTTSHDDRIRWFRLEDGRENTPPAAFAHSCNLVAAANGRRALGFENNFAHVFDGPNRRDWRFDACTLGRDPLVAAAISADGARLAWVCASGLVALLDADTGVELQRFDPTVTRRSPAALAFAPDGQRLVVAARDGSLTRIDLGPSPRVVELATNHRGTRHVHLLNTVPWAAVTDERGTPRFVRLDDGAHLFDLPRGAAALAFNVAPDDTLHTLATENTRWRIDPTAALPASASGFSTLAVAPDGTRVAVGEESRINLFDLKGGSATRDWGGPMGRMVKGLAFTPDGNHLISAHVGAPHASLIDLNTHENRVLDGIGGPLRRVLVFNDGALAAIPYREAVDLYRLAATDPRATLLASTPLATELRDVALDPSGTHAAWLDAGGRFGIMQPVADTLRLTAATPAMPGASCVAATSASDRFIVAGGVPPVVSTCDLTQCQTLLQLSERPADLALSPDESLLAVGLVDGEVLVFNTHDRALRLRARAHADRAANVAFADQGRTLVSAGWDGRIARFDLTTLEAAPDTLLHAIIGRWGSLATTTATYPREPEIP
jgi:WD40 repeat protein